MIISASKLVRYNSAICTDEQKRKINLDIYRSPETNRSYVKIYDMVLNSDDLRNLAREMDIQDLK